MKEIQLISEKLFDRLNWENCNLEHIGIDLTMVNIVDFLAYNFSRYPSVYIDHYFMFATIHYWEHLSLQEWKKIIDKCVNVLGLTTCLSFLYRNLEIDSFLLLNESHNISNNLKSEIKQFFENMSGTLGRVEKYHHLTISKFGITEEKLSKINQMLVEQGALKVEKKIIQPIKLSDLDDLYKV